MRVLNAGKSRVEAAADAGAGNTVAVRGAVPLATSTGAGSVSRHSIGTEMGGRLGDLHCRHVRASVRLLTLAKSKQP